MDGGEDAGRPHGPAKPGQEARGGNDESLKVTGAFGDLFKNLRNPALFAPVDQYFDLFSVISFKEEGSSIEEAYFYTKTLPAHLRLKGGKFKSNFSVHNDTHPHDRDFADPPSPTGPLRAGMESRKKGRS
jgi:hypothetical protein